MKNETHLFVAAFLFSLATGCASTKHSVPFLDQNTATVAAADVHSNIALLPAAIELAEKQEEKMRATLQNYNISNTTFAQFKSDCAAGVWTVSINRQKSLVETFSRNSTWWTSGARGVVGENVINFDAIRAGTKASVISYELTVGTIIHRDGASGELKVCTEAPNTDAMAFGKLSGCSKQKGALIRPVCDLVFQTSSGQLFDARLVSITFRKK